MNKDQSRILAVNASKWDSFCDRFTQDPLRIVFAEAAIADIGALNSLVAKSVAAATSCVDEYPSRRIRVFQGNALDYACAERLVYGGYSGNDPLDWLNYLGGQEQLCIAINDLDAWGPDLAETCAGELVPSLSHYLEQNWLVIDWYGFITSVGWTPFGIHADDEPSLLLNLGPGSKTAWIWEPNVLPRLSSGRATSLHFTALLEEADKFTLKPGDAIAIPAGHFHVLKSDSPCTILGAGLYPVNYMGELAAFLSSETAPVEGHGGTVVDNMAALLPMYLDTVRHKPTTDNLDRFVCFLRAKTKSLSFSRTPRCSPPPQAVEDFESQEFTVARHPIVVAGERVVLANGQAVAVPTDSVDGIALRTWLLQHPRFRGHDYLDAFELTEAGQARRIANQLLYQGNLRLSGPRGA